MCFLLRVRARFCHLSATRSRRAAALIRAVDTGSFVQPGPQVSGKTGLSPPATGAWRNRGTDKTPDPKPINIKAADSFVFLPVLCHRSLHKKTHLRRSPSSSRRPAISAFDPPIIHGRGCLTPPHPFFLFAHPLVYSVCGLSGRSSAGNPAERALASSAQGKKKKKV